MARLVVDPVTRVGGNLRVEVELDGGTVSNAWSSGTSFRGIELVLQGRAPRDAWLFADRVCGSCSTVHALASVRAVENALQISIPTNARLIRNLIAGARYAQSHVTQFYHQQAFDWVDVTAAARADPAATATLARSLSDWPKSDAAYFTSARARLAALVTSGQPGLFAGDAAGHPAYTASPETSLLILAHYLEALDWRRQVTSLLTILGGKSPHPQTYLVGGMALAAEWGGPNRPSSGEHPWQVEGYSPNALGAAGLTQIGSLITTAKSFVEQVYVPDVVALARAYPSWARIGSGLGMYLSYGDFPEDDTDSPALLLPNGRISDRDLSSVRPAGQASVGESVAWSHYAAVDPAARPNPALEDTSPLYRGPALPYTTLDGAAAYSWVKAPRYDGDPMEVGPLARLLVAYATDAGVVRDQVDGLLSELRAGPDVLFSTLGRTIARAIEARIVVNRLDTWLGSLVTNLASGDLAVADVTSWDPGTWPSSASGWAIGEGPRGAVGHWVSIRDGLVDRYQIVDGSTWNLSPRDGAGRLGALEAALVGTPVADPARPVEVLRTIHSLDPCPACAAHVYRPRSGESVWTRLGRATPAGGTTR